MNKKALREDIETIVRFVPRPLLSEKLLPKNRNSWLILDEYENGEGIVVLTASRTTKESFHTIASGNSGNLIC